MLKRRSFLKKTIATTTAALGAVIGTTASFPKPAISQSRIRWSMTTTWPKNFPGLGTGPNILAEYVKKASNGRMDIKVYGAGEIVPAFYAGCLQGSALQGACCKS